MKEGFNAATGGWWCGSGGAESIDSIGAVPNWGGTPSGEVGSKMDGAVSLEVTRGSTLPALLAPSLCCFAGPAP
jgi:hypothetical protein